MPRSSDFRNTNGGSSPCLKKFVAASLLVAALGAANSTVAWAGCPFWCTTESEWAISALE
jgi:hypothetical protein